MKKLIVIIFAVSIIHFAFVLPVSANALTLEAENGKILAPFKIGVDASGMVQKSNGIFQNYQIDLSYGLSPAITVAGSFKNEGEDREMVAKALFSPLTKGGGYTVYGGYDFLNSRLAMYGGSMWADLKFLMAFVNYQSNIDQNDLRFASVTPGLNLKLGSKVRISGEVELNSEDWKTKEIRVGSSYRFNPNLTGKFAVTEGRSNGEGRTYQTGLTIEI